MRSKSLSLANRLRISSAVMVSVAILLVLFVALPSRSGEAESVKSLETAEASTAALQARLDSYVASGFSAEEFESTVLILDAEIPFSGTYPRCENDTNQSVFSSTELNHTNIKFALSSAMNASGIEAEVAQFSKTPVVLDGSSSLSAYAVPVEIPAGPEVLEQVISVLDESGFLVTSDSVIVTATQETTEIPAEPAPIEFTENGEPIFADQQMETVTTTVMSTSARLIFWYSATPMFNMEQAVAEACDAAAEQPTTETDGSMNQGVNEVNDIIDEELGITPEFEVELEL